MAFQNKTLLVFIFFDLLFLACAVLLIALPAGARSAVGSSPSPSSVAQTLLLDECPLTAAIANGVIMLLTFAVSLPGILIKRNRNLLVIHSWLLIVNAIFTLGVGLAIWFTTLQTKTNLVPVWARQPDPVKSALQAKFQCCGYADPSKFVTDDTCPNATAAAAKGLCIVPLSAFANSFLDIVFTSMFGFCAVDGFLLLSGLCVLKDRAEKARYKFIDQKREFGRL